MPDDEAGLLHRVRSWIAEDPDPACRAELKRLVSSRDLNELRERMLRPLEFGTAGIRGVVGAGPARMNHAVVRRTTRAVAEHLLATEPAAKTRAVVVAYDARRNSRAFAVSAAGVLAAAGLPVCYFTEPVPTPLAVFAADQLGAVAAVVITASHNPPEYNGYKLYDSNAAQITAPTDQQISARLTQVGAARDIACAPGVLDGEHPRCRTAPAGLFERYLAKLDALRPAGRANRDLRIVYTPLHGVGWKFAEQALRHGGFAELHVVPAQADPDGGFPTVRFPNPEEPAALALAIELATELNADLVLANDPDADRLAVCVPGRTGGWATLTGNQVGLLLAEFLLENAASVPQPLVVSTMVSCPMLESLVRAHRARLEWTFTGFKWIAAAARELERAAGVRFVFGYEEAMGYTPAGLLRDKDGIGAGLLFADLAAQCRAQGLRVTERLDRLYRQHGLWVSAQRKVPCPGLDGAQRLHRALVSLARRPPSGLGGRRVVAADDYLSPDAKRPAWRSVAPVVKLDLAGNGRVFVRPSGTEPTLKIYVDLRASVADNQETGQLEEQAQAEAETIALETARHLELA